MLCGGKCNSRNSKMEVTFGPLFECTNYAFRPDGSTTCASSKCFDTAQNVFEEDYRKHSMNGLSHSETATATEFITCGNNTMIYSESSINGVMVCVSGAHAPDMIRKDYLKIVKGEVFMADFTNKCYSRWQNITMVKDTSTCST